MIRNPYQQYQQTQVETATPEKLTLMLYDGGIKFLNLAKQALEARELAAVNNYLIRAQNIVLELQASINHEAGGEIAANLSLLYDYMYRQLLQANIRKDVALIDEVLGMFRELRETWAQAIELAKGEQQQILAGADGSGAN